MLVLLALPVIVLELLVIVVVVLLPAACLVVVLLSPLLVGLVKVVEVGSLVHHVICLFLHVFLLVLPLVVVPVLERRAFKQLLLGSLLGLEVLVRVSLNSDLVLAFVQVWELPQDWVQGLIVAEHVFEALEDELAQIVVNFGAISLVGQNYRAQVGRLLFIQHLLLKLVEEQALDFEGAKPL